jgi:hypothetical protein
LPKCVLPEAQNVATCVDVILQLELQKGTSNIIFNERLLHRMKNACDEPRGCFIDFQRNPVIHFLFEVPEKTQVEALKYLIHVRWESDHLSLMICQKTQQV